MSTELATTGAQQSVTQFTPMSAKDLAQRSMQITKAMESVFIKEVHYGVIAGTTKPTLYKAGAEKLLVMFQISCEPEVQDLSTDEIIRYRVRAIGRHIPTGNLVGVGIGECSSDEAKYAWRAALSDEEFDSTEYEDKRVKFAKGGQQGKVYKTNQIRTNPSDQANTVLKMAKKRAMVDLCLTALGASDAFEQDLEDLEDGSIRQRKRPDTKKPTATDTGQGVSTAGQSSPTSNAAAEQSEQAGELPCATPRQIGLIQRRLGVAGVAEKAFFSHFNIVGFEELPFAKVDEALRWIEQVAKG